MTTFIKNDKNRRRFNILGHLWQSKLCNYTIQCPVLMTPFVHLVFCRHYHDSSSIMCHWDILSFFFFLAETHLRGWEAARLTPYTRILLAKRAGVRTIFEWPRKMVSVSVRYLFYEPMDEKIKTWTLQSPAKENPNMEKALFDRPTALQYDVKAKYRIISRKFLGWSFFTRASA